MISSKLIFFFCFYLLLDNSLGQKALVEEAKNKQTFKKALDFGATYGGDLGQLGSQWKQLLFELVQAKRKVGLSKYQLARFNDSATTEEVGLARTDGYTDKVAELVAVRTQDIGTTQKYVDDLEILQNEIALTMIVKMEELEEKFKETNVRKKVKEAKENGITDTDIKEILFAEYLNSGGVLPLVGGGASTGDALLSSFLNGMESILGGNYYYYETLSILQYGNVVGCLPFGYCVGGGGDNGGDNNNGGDNGDQGGTAGGGGPGAGPGGAAGGGDQPPGGGGGPPDRRPADKIIDEDDQEETNDERIEDDVNTFFENFLAELPDYLKETRTPSPDDLEEIRVSVPEDVELWLFHLDDTESDEEGFRVDPSRTIPNIRTHEADEAFRLVDMSMERRRASIQRIEDRIQLLESERAVDYFRSARLQEPYFSDLNDTEKIQELDRRINYLQNLLDSARRVNSELHERRIIFERNYYRARDNFYYYGDRIGWDLSVVPYSHKDFLIPPPQLPEFENPVEPNSMRYLISRAHLHQLILIGQRLETANSNLRKEIDFLKIILGSEEALLAILQDRKK